MTEEQHNDPGSDPVETDTPDEAADVDAGAAADAGAPATDAPEDLDAPGRATDAPEEVAPEEAAPGGATAAPEDVADDTPASGGTAPAVGVQYGIGGFSLREVILAGVWLVAFVVSFFSTSTFGFSSVWTSGIDWILMIGVPTVAVFLLVLRRLSPSGIRRVGSLGIDQFASVGFSVAAVLWLGQIWAQLGVTIAGGPWVTSWVIWVELVMMLAGVVLTVFGPVVPGLSEDFRDRPQIPAHRSARGARPVTTRPRPVAAPGAGQPYGQDPYAQQPQPYGQDAYAQQQPYGQDPYAQQAYGNDPYAQPSGQEQYTGQEYAAAGAAQQPADQAAPQTAQAGEQAQQAPVQQAFWALAPEERDVVDENGTPLFRIGPTAWALVIEDRGSSYVIRHEDGRVGLLTDVSGVTRG